MGAASLIHQLYPEGSRSSLAAPRTSASACQLARYMARRNCCHFWVRLATPSSVRQETTKSGVILPFGETSTVIWLCSSDRHPPAPCPSLPMCYFSLADSYWIRLARTEPVALAVKHLPVTASPLFPCAEKVAEILLEFLARGPSLRRGICLHCGLDCAAVLRGPGGGCRFCLTKDKLNQINPN